MFSPPLPPPRTPTGDLLPGACRGMPAVPLILDALPKIVGGALVFGVVGGGRHIMTMRPRARDRLKDLDSLDSPLGHRGPGRSTGRPQPPCCHLSLTAAVRPAPPALRIEYQDSSSDCGAASDSESEYSENRRGPPSPSADGYVPLGYTPSREAPASSPRGQ